jgi:hypothetical protein
MNTWQSWLAVLKNAYGSAPPMLQSTIGTFANFIRQNYGKEVVGFDSTKTLGELPDIKLDKLGKLDLSTIDFGSLKQAVSNTPYNGLFDQLAKLNLVLPAYNDSVRDFLTKQNLKDAEGNPLEIGYDNKTRTVTLGGKTFLTQDKFMIKDQKALSSLETLNTALNDYLKTNTTVKTEMPAVENEFTMMTPTELSDYITITGYEGQKDFYNDMLKVLNDKESIISQRVNDLWNPYIESATKSLDAAYNVKMSALESQRGQVSANYAGAIQGIEKAIMSSRARTKEDMNARGLLFSGLLTRALSQVEAIGVEKKAEIYAKEAADLNTIASQLAVLTANLPIEKDALSQQLLFQKASQLFNLLSANDTQKDTVSQALAQVELNIKSLEKTAGARGEIATREAMAAQIEAQNKAAQQEFENSIKTGNLLISQGNLSLAEKMNAATIKNIESQIEKRDADIWKIYRDVELANKKFAAEGTPTTMKLTDAQKLLDKQNSLLADIAQQTKEANATEGTLSALYGTTITKESKATAQAVIDNDKQQLSLLAGGFVQAKATIMAQWSPDEADVLIGIQQWIYQYFKTTNDYELYGYLVKQVLETGQYENMSLQDYLKKMGYSNAWTILTDWANLLPVSMRGQGH